LRSIKCKKDTSYSVCGDCYSSVEVFSVLTGKSLAVVMPGVIFTPFWFLTDIGRSCCLFNNDQKAASFFIGLLELKVKVAFVVVCLQYVYIYIYIKLLIYIYISRQSASEFSI